MFYSVRINYTLCFIGRCMMLVIGLLNKWQSLWGWGNI